jgi:hypothetical protein
MSEQITRQEKCSSPDWCTPGRFALLLAAFIFASYPHVLVGLQAFNFRDFGLFSYPLASFQRESFWRGEIPFWNPYNHCGIPFLAQWSTLVFYPLSLFYLLLPLSWSLSVFCLIHLFIGGMGMYFLARRWIDSGFSAFVAGMCFAVNGLMLSFMMSPHIMVTAAWIPWVIYACERAWHGDGRWICNAAILGSLQMLGGVPEFIMQTWVTVCGFAALVILTKACPARKVLGRTSAIILLVAGLTAFQMLPFLDFLQHSDRNAAFTNDSWTMPCTGWANLLVPLFNCYKWRAGVFFQIQQWYVSSYYMGIITVALAIVALLCVRTSRVRFLGLIALTGLMLALGDQGYVYKWFRYIFPFLGFMRFPVKFLLLMGFAMPLLAGYGTKACTDRTSNARSILVWIGATFALLSAAILVFASHHLLPWEQWEDTYRSGISRLIFLAAGILLIRLFAKVVIGSRLVCLSVAFLMLLWLDIETYAPDQNPTLPRYVYEVGLTKTKDLNPSPRLGYSRFLLSPVAKDQLSSSVSTNRIDDYLIHRIAYFANCNILDDVPKVDGFIPICLRYEREVLTELYREPPTESQAALADFVGASQVTRPGTLFTWQARTNFMPMVFSGQRPRFVPETETLAAMFLPDFDPRQVVILPADAISVIHATNGVAAEITMKSVSGQQLTFRVKSQEAAIVTIAQSFYHPWRAWIDGKPTVIWRANHAFQAIEVPSGDHEVHLAYVDISFFIGLAISAITFLLMLVFWIRSR